MGKPVQRMELYEPIVFRLSVPAGGTGKLSERIKALGTTEFIRVIFPPGPAGTLQITPFIRRLGEKLDPLLTFPIGGNQYISGDNEILPYTCIFPVVTDEWIDIYYNNTDTTNAHELKVDVFVDYYGGQQRIIGGLIGGGM